MDFVIPEAPKGAEERLRRLTGAMREICKKAKRPCYDADHELDHFLWIDGAALLQQIESRRRSCK